MIAAEDRLAGDLTSTASDSGLLTDSVTGEFLDGTWQPTSEAGISDALSAAGDGSRGVVGLDWAGGGGHYLNVVERGGTTYFVDAQTGSVGTSLSELYPNTPIKLIQWFMTAP
jgi:hypothetical protein